MKSQSVAQVGEEFDRRSDGVGGEIRFLIAEGDVVVGAAEAHHVEDRIEIDDQDTKVIVFDAGEGVAPRC